MTRESQPEAEERSLVKGCLWSLAIVVPFWVAVIVLVKWLAS